MGNILVTGGCGFIGSNLVDKLIEENEKVIVIDDLSTGQLTNKNSSAKYFEESILDYINDKEKLCSLLNDNDIDIVYHLAALADVRLSIHDPINCYNVNHLASISILDICYEVGVKKFIFASTSAVYGTPEYQPVDEKHPVNPISPYGLSKLAFEQYLQYKSLSNNNIEIVIFRLPNVYGPRQRADLEGGVIAIFQHLMENNNNVTFFGKGDQTRDWVHVYDIVKVFSFVINKKLNTFNIISIGSQVEKTLWDLFNYLSSELKYKKLPIIINKRDGDIKHMCLSNTKLKEVFNWEPEILLSEGIKKLK